MTDHQGTSQDYRDICRRSLLRAGAGLAGTALMPSLLGPAFAVGVSDQPPVGTWPAGQQGDTVYIGAAVPRTSARRSSSSHHRSGGRLQAPAR